MIILFNIKIIVCVGYVGDILSNVVNKCILFFVMCLYGYYELMFFDMLL